MNNEANAVLTKATNIYAAYQDALKQGKVTASKILIKQYRILAAKYLTLVLN